MFVNVSRLTAGAFNLKRLPLEFVNIKQYISAVEDYYVKKV